MKSAILNKKEVIVLSEFSSKAEVVFMDGRTEIVSVFDLSNVRYNTTQYNSRSVDFLSLSDEDQIKFIQNHRSERATMRAESAAAKKIKNSKAPKAKKARAKKPKLSAERQAVLDSLMNGGFKL